MQDNNDTHAGLTHLPDAADEAVAVVDPKRLAERYVTLWSQPDPDVRGTIIHELWAPAGAHILEPPQELRQPANALGS